MGSGQDRMMKLIDTLQATGTKAERDQYELQDWHVWLELPP